MAGMTVGKITVESDPTLTKISEQLAELIALLKADKTIHIDTGNQSGTCTHVWTHAPEVGNDALWICTDCGKEHGHAHP